jgi:hypothetical protein
MVQKGGPALPVGWRVLVVAPNGGSRRIPLLADDGVTSLATVAKGSEVEILAWQPNRGGHARYRVLSRSEGVEGWLGAENLMLRPVPAVPRLAVRPAAVESPMKIARAGAARTRKSTANGPARAGAR